MSDQRQESRLALGKEFRGKTVEAAISTGLAALQVSRDEVEVEIIKAGSRGVLGIGAEDAVIRLSVISRPGPEKEPEPPPPAPEPKAPPKPVSTPQKARDSARPPVQEPQPAPGSRPKSRTTRTKPAVESKPARSGTSSMPASTRNSSAWAEGDKSTPQKARDSAAAIEQGQEVLQGLLVRMNLHARVEIVPQSDAEADESERVQVLNIVGEDLGVLIGRQNEVLMALELITRLMVNQRVHGKSDFVVDVNGYRAKRAESLQKLALRMAEQAVQTGRTAVLEPMPPAERRIIHLALRDHPAVTTQSVGEGDRRKVTIIPKRG